MISVALFSFLYFVVFVRFVVIVVVGLLFGVWCLLVVDCWLLCVLALCCFVLLCVVLFSAPVTCPAHLGDHYAVHFRERRLPPQQFENDGRRIHQRIWTWASNSQAWQRRVSVRYFQEQLEQYPHQKCCQASAGGVRGAQNPEA